MKGYKKINDETEEGRNIITQEGQVEKMGGGRKTVDHKEKLRIDGRAGEGPKGPTGEKKVDFRGTKKN
jgi:hypothetical protein